ncbi:MAG: type III-B CRISPR module-associated protein Cmr5 [Chloroflexota bacterium]
MTNQPTQSQQQTLQQRRAKSAWLNVEQVTHLQKEYGSLVRGLPAMILGEGLGQTLAFLKAKDKNRQDTEHWQVYKDVSDWVVAELRPKPPKIELLELVLTCDSNEYRRAATEALAYLSWLKRFAEAKGFADTPNGGH